MNECSELGDALLCLSFFLLIHPSFPPNPKNSRLMDELVGEIHALRQSMDELRSNAADTHNWMDAMSKSVKEIEEKLKEFESLRMAESPGEAIAGELVIRGLSC